MLPPKKLLVRPSYYNNNKFGQQQQQSPSKEVVVFIDLTKSQLRSIPSKEEDPSGITRVVCFSDVLEVKEIPFLFNDSDDDDDDYYDGEEEDDVVDRYEIWYSNYDIKSFRSLYRKEQARYALRMKSCCFNIHQQHFVDDDKQTYSMEGLDIKNGRAVRSVVQAVLREQVLQKQESGGGEIPVVDPETLSFISKFLSSRSVEEAFMRGLKLQSDINK